MWRMPESSIFVKRSNVAQYGYDDDNYDTDDDDGGGGGGDDDYSDDDNRCV